VNRCFQGARAGGSNHRAFLAGITGAGGGSGALAKAARARMMLLCSFSSRGEVYPVGRTMFGMASDLAGQFRAVEERQIAGLAAAGKHSGVGGWCRFGPVLGRTDSDCCVGLQPWSFSRRGCLPRLVDSSRP
jgi:hypothetical protein